MTQLRLPLAAYVDGVLAGDRALLARAITLVESDRAADAAAAAALLDAVLPHAGRSHRVGITGVPGAGKSTCIDVLGMHLVRDRGHRVAVLSVDPSSPVSGGSILGDKTRMERLSVEPMAYVRPSPSGGTFGGVATATREAIRVVEAAGYAVVIVETVGVGQSEAAVAGMTDMFILLQLPNAGDDLQAIKKGVMELADLVVVNKADLDPAAADRAVGQVESALQLVGHRASTAWAPRAMTSSALDAARVAAVWDVAEAFRAARAGTGAAAERRRSQARAWLWDRIDAGLRQAFRSHPGVRASLAETTAAVDDDRLPVSVAARRLLADFSGGDGRLPDAHE